MAAARRIVPTEREGSAEKRVAALAARQHGVVSRAQLLALGIRSSAVRRRVDSGRLHPVHLGVYSVGHPILDRRVRWMAAVLACGPGAALGYASAGALWNLRRSGGARIDVVVPGGAGRGRSGIRVHRHPGLTPGEVTTREGIPVTTPARTILDLAATVGDRQLKHALDQVEIQELTDYPALDALARAHARLRGATRLRKLLDSYEAGTARTRSDLEIAFLELSERHGLPRPLVNEELLTGLTVDFVFATERVAVEADSWQWHRGRAAFERDRERDAVLAAKGYRTLRFTDRQIENDPPTVARALTAALTARAA
jgi:predicted transcriptional regulator of viral defense system